jgi:hypothetical protein
MWATRHWRRRREEGNKATHIFYAMQDYYFELICISYSVEGDSGGESVAVHLDICVGPRPLKHARTGLLT